MIIEMLKSEIKNSKTFPVKLSYLKKLKSSIFH